MNKYIRMNLFGAPDLEQKAQKMTDCNYVMSEYLLDQYFFYRYREIFSFIAAALLVPAFLRYFKMKNGSYFRTYLFLFVVWYVVKMVITAVVKQMIPTDALHKLLTRCQGWQSDKKTMAACKAVINPDEASQYLKEGFENAVPVPHGDVTKEKEDVKKDGHGKPMATGVADMRPAEPAPSNEQFEGFANPTLVGAPVCKDMYAPLNSKCAPGCMQDNNMRKTSCLGLEPTSDINYPGGGAYQVQSAATVQARLVNNNYVPGNCLDMLQD